MLHGMEAAMRLGSKGPWRCDHILAVRKWFMEHEVPKLIDSPQSSSHNKIIIFNEHEAITVTGI
jgi:hypothetical protein